MIQFRIRTAICLVIGLFIPIRSVLGVELILTSVGGTSERIVVPANTPISIVGNNALRIVRIYSLTTPLEDIGPVTLLDGGGTNTIFVLIAGQTSVIGTSPQPTGCRNLAGFESTRRNVELVVSISGDLLGNILASEIYSINVLQTVRAPITSGVDSNDPGVAFFVSAGSISSLATIESRASDIGTSTTTTNMLATVRAPLGGIGSITAGGSIGFAHSPVTISALADNSAGKGIDLVRGSNIYGVIVGAAADSRIGRVETTGAVASPSGDRGIMSGSVQTAIMTAPAPGGAPPISISGDLKGNITITTDLFGPLEIAGDVLPGSVIRIGGVVETNPAVSPALTGRINIAGSMHGTIDIGQTLRGPLTVGTPAGLTGRVFINNQIVNGLPGTSQWLQPVTVAGVELATRPYYSNTASSIGGGSVGLVPFQLHATDCSPIANEALAYCSARSEIRMRHYGPVAWNPADGDPFIVERRRIGSTSEADWLDQSACFTQTLDTNTTVVVLSAALCTPAKCTGILNPGYQYRVRQRLRASDSSFVLRSDVPGLPSVAAHSAEYNFTVGVASEGDADGNGKVDFDDTTIVLANWLATGCLVKGDADRRRGAGRQESTSTTPPASSRTG